MFCLLKLTEPSFEKSAHPDLPKGRARGRRSWWRWNGILQSQDCFATHQSLIINLQEEVLIPVTMTPQQLIWLFLKKVVIHVFKSNQRESTAVEMVDTEQDINIDDMNDSGNMEVCLVCLFVFSHGCVWVCSETVPSGKLCHLIHDYGKGFI